MLTFLSSLTLNIRYKKEKDLKTKGLVEIENSLEKNENSCASQMIWKSELIALMAKIAEALFMTLDVNCIDPFYR